MIRTLRRAFLAAAGGALASPLLVAAPARARATPGEVRLLSTYVCGTAYHGAAAQVRELRPGDALELRRAPDNAYDPRAVEVRTPQGAKLGYVPRIDNQALASLMDAGFVPRARVRAVTPDALRPEIHFDVAFAIKA